MPQLMMDVITYPCPLKIESRYDANFVVISGIGGCRYNDENLVSCTTFSVSNDSLQLIWRSGTYLQEEAWL